MVFQELAPSQSHKVKNRRDLESELFGSCSSSTSGVPSVRDNEGEAAEHGIYYDDTEYDYMQHIRGLDAGNRDDDVYFMEAKVGNKEKRGKGKMSLEEALRTSSLQEQQQSDSGASRVEELLGAGLLPSRDLRKTSYQEQQDVPDDLAGFQPDMDPRLREVLEALDDEAYVDDKEDLFCEITMDGGEVSLEKFEEIGFAEEGDRDEDGWESDTTEKPSKEYTSDTPIMPPPSIDAPMPDAPPQALDHGDGNWMKEFSKFKADQKTAPKPLKSSQNSAGTHSSVLTGASYLPPSRRKKRKGALTSSTGYSMTSSSLARTEGQTLLDARFDKIEEEYADNHYNDDDIDMDTDAASIFSKSSLASKTSNLSRTSNLSGISGGSSQAPPLTNSRFEGIMDEFLEGYSMSGKKRVRKGEKQSGIEQLDEVRKGLGPARIRGRVGKV